MLFAKILSADSPFHKQLIHLVRRNNMLDTRIISTRPYDFREALVVSQKVNWRIEDIIGGDKQLDFTKPFMPESLARVSNMDYLTSEEKLVLNQIKGHTYLQIFGLVEEFILPFVLDHVRPSLDDDDYRVRANVVQ